MTTVPARAGHFRRDRLTISLYSAFVAWGWYLYAFTPAVPLIAAEQGTSLGIAGLHGTALAAGAVLSGLTSPLITLRHGRWALHALGGGILAAGVLLLVLGPGIAATLSGSLIASVGGNYLVTAAQPALSVHHGTAGPSAVTEGNGFGSGMGLLAPLAVGGSVALGWGWRPAVALAIGFMALSAVLVSTLRKDPALAPPARPPEVVSRRGNRYSTALWFFLVAMTCGIAIEMSTSMWAPDLLVSRAGAPASLATAAVAAMILGMTAARFVVGPLAATKAPEKLLLLSFTIALAGWLVLWLATTPAVAVVGLLVAGIGYGAHYPLGMSLVLRSSAGRPDQAQGLSMLGAGLAIGVVPFALGSLADAYGTHLAFVMIGLLIAIGGTAVAFGLRAVHQALRETVRAADTDADADAGTDAGTDTDADTGAGTGADAGAERSA